MKRILRAFGGLLTLSWLLASCLSSNDDTTTGYDDVSIQSFTLGKLNRYLHTTARSGADSLYKTTYTASTYKMSIDQLGGRIFNDDSLLIGTDARHVICTVTTKNGGVVYLKSMTSDTLAYFNSGKDSVDFSQPRLFRVFSTDGTTSRDYTVTLNVRSQQAGRMVWTLMDPATPLPTTPTTDWQFAVGDDGRTLYASRDQWATRRTESLDSDASLLPTRNAAFTSWPLSAGMSYALMVGDSDAQPQAAVVWRKLFDDDSDHTWVYMPIAPGNPYYLPGGCRYWLLPYTDGTVLAADSAGHLYRSADQGITWLTSASLQSPTDDIAAAATDGNGGLWLRTGGDTPAVWRGVLTE